MLTFTLTEINFRQITEEQRTELVNTLDRFATVNPADAEYGSVWPFYTLHRDAAGAVHVTLTDRCGAVIGTRTL